MDQGQNIFIKLQLYDRLRILNELIGSNGDIQCKLVKTHQFITLRPLAVEGGKELICQKQADIPPPTGLPAEAVINFNLGQHRYFFHATLPKCLNNIFRLTIPESFFQLQRRRAYRILLPDEYPAYTTLRSWEPGHIEFHGRLLDLSQGGCRLKLSEGVPVVTSGQILSGQIQIGLRPPFQFQGVARHIRPGDHQIVGLEFQSITPIFLSRIKSVMLEVHRDLFHQKKGA